MGNSVVDLGAAALDYAEGVWDYMTGAPEASASGGYYKNLGPGARQYFSGPGDYKKTNPVMEYFGFEDGGSPAVELQDDGSLPGVDALRYMTPQEVEDGSYNFLQNMEEQMLGHLAAAQSVHSEDIPVRQSLDMKRYHYGEAEKLRDQIEQFKERRARAIQNYPESETKLYMKEGESPYVKGFPDDLVENYHEGGIVGQLKSLSQVSSGMGQKLNQLVNGQSGSSFDFNYGGGSLPAVQQPVINTEPSGPVANIGSGVPTAQPYNHVGASAINTSDMYGGIPGADNSMTMGTGLAAGGDNLMGVLPNGGVIAGQPGPGFGLADEGGPIDPFRNPYSMPSGFTPLPPGELGFTENMVGQPEINIEEMPRPAWDPFGGGGASKFSYGGVVSLGAGEPAYIDMGNMDMNSMFATPAQPGDEYYVGEYPGRVYREGDYITEPGYLGPEYEFEVEDPRRFDVYEDSGQFAPPLMDKALEPYDAEGRARPTYPSFQEYIEVDESGKYPAFGIMASLGKDADRTSPLQAAPEYPGIEGFDIYRDLAPEQFKRRPIDKQNFDKKRGFQYGQMVRLEAMDNKLMKMAGASPQSLGPAAMDQMSDILGREVG